jgi:hypothetical protein
MIPGIELKALRKSLFFGTREAASLIGVTNESQWLKWESGAQEMPEAIAQAFCYVLDWRNEMLEKARKLLRDNPDLVLHMPWYDSLDDWISCADHNPQLWRPDQSICSTLLVEFLKSVYVLRFNLPQYAIWLGSQQDDRNKRVLWASMQLDKAPTNQNLKSE